MCDVWRSIRGAGKWGGSIASDLSAGSELRKRSEGSDSWKGNTVSALPSRDRRGWGEKKHARLASLCLNVEFYSYAMFCRERLNFKWKKGGEKRGQIWTEYPAVYPTCVRTPSPLSLARFAGSQKRRSCNITVSVLLFWA